VGVACRAGTTGATYATGSQTLNDIAWYDRNSKNSTQPVARLAANPWGLHDMLGNVWEWCDDHWHDNYDGAPNDGSAWLDSDGGAAARVVRGGSWIDGARHARAAYRTGDDPADRNNDVGFRCARVRNPG
jgi:formylglycine-generating enzyme required for sulfatase activity